MSDIFVSYASSDRERVRPLVEALEAEGFSVWWDRTIRAGTTYDREIEKAIDDARCMVVVWSVNSIESEYVRSEVEEGARHDILVPVLIDDVLPPLAHRRRQAANLIDWSPGDRSGECETLLVGVRTVLESPGGQAPEQSSVGSHRSRPRPTVSRRSAVLGALVIAGGVLGASWFAFRPAPPVLAPPIRFEIGLPDGVSLGGMSRSVAISDDGRRIYLRTNGSYPLHLRDLGELEARPIEVDGVGRRDMGSIRLSGDGEWLAFRFGVGWKRVPVSGGAAVTLTQHGENVLGWRDDVIVVGRNRGLARVRLSGQVIAQLTDPPEGEYHTQAHVLPGGEAVLFSIGPSYIEHERIAALSLLTGEQKDLGPGTSPRYTASGHLLFAREGSIWAAAFDVEALSIAGDATPVLEGIVGRYNQTYAVSETGTLVYVTTVGSGVSDLVWVDQVGRETPVGAEPGRYAFPRVSPDGTRIAVIKEGNEGEDIWLLAPDRASATRLTIDEAPKTGLVWRPDGGELAFASNDGDGPTRLRSIVSDGSSGIRLLTEAGSGGSDEEPGRPGYAQWPSSWSRDGDELLFVATAASISMLSLDDGRVTVVRESPSFDSNPVLSPDGGWLAYQSNESGAEEVYVRPFPDVAAGRWQISNGGSEPRWGPDGTEIYYLGPESLMRTKVDTGSGFVASPPETLFALARYVRSRRGHSYDLSHDGQRFLMVKPQSQPRRQIVVVENWFEELNRLVPID